MKTEEILALQICKPVIEKLENYRGKDYTLQIIDKTSFCDDFDMNLRDISVVVHHWDSRDWVDIYTPHINAETLDNLKNKLEIPLGDFEFEMKLDDFLSQSIEQQQPYVRRHPRQHTNIDISNIV